MKKKNIQILKFVIFLIILIGGAILLWIPLERLFSNASSFREFIRSFGIFAPLAFIILAILQVLLAPIPGQIVGVAGGYIFGAFFGILYSMIGAFIGSFIAFYLSRKLGKPFVTRVINKKTLNKFKEFMEKRGTTALLLVYLLPAMPDDVISYVAGITNMKTKTFLLVSTIGRLPGFIALSFIGAGIASGNLALSIGLSVAIGVIFFVVYLNRKKLEKFMSKTVEKLKEEI